MLARRLNGAFPAVRLQEEMDRLFTDFVREWPALGSLVPAERAFPTLNIWEDDHNLYAEAELPGMNIQDIEISVAGNELSIKGKRETVQGDKANYHRRERGTGEFSRLVTLPVEMDPDKVEAVLKNGVLFVRLPKAPSAKARQIEVKAR